MRDPRSLEVPRAFEESTIAREGDAGRRWLEALPAVVDRLCREWTLTVEGPPRHGYVAIVVPVLRHDVPLMLKVSWIDPSSEHEALALRSWGGRGAVRLIDERPEAGAMLLERLDAARSLEGVPIDEAVAVAADLLRRLSTPAPPGLRGVDVEVEDMRAFMVRTWDAVGRPFPRRLLDAALEASLQDAGTPERCLVNQDLHYGNVLAGTREPWLVIDPKPLAGDPEFGVAPLLWTRFDELTGRAALLRRLDTIVDRAGLDRERAARRALLRAVEAWLWALDQGPGQAPDRFRALSAWLTADPVG